MKAVPLKLKQANAYVAQHHRHSDEVQGCRFAIGAEKDGRLVGVAICGRPNSQHLDDGLVLDVSRVCTDGTHNACSFLYARCVRIGQLMGYRQIITYTLASETGHTVKLARQSRQEPVFVEGRQADRPSRRRKLRKETPDRWRWVLWDAEE